MKKRTFIKLSSLTMAGTVLSPLIDLAQDEKLKNWAGNYQYSTTRLAIPQSLADIQSFVKEHPKFKVLGTRHCFNNIADSRDYLLSSGKINKVIALDKSAQTVTVEGGIRYGELATYLYSQGLALHNLASLPHISVAGACITATHGSGVKNGNLSSALVGLELVNAAGELIRLNKERDGERFAGAVVNLGGIGVVTKLTLSVQPSFDVRQDVYENLSLAQLEQHFDEIMSAGYSVSLFTDWRNKNFNEVWIKSRMDQPLHSLVAPEFFGAKAARKNLHPIAELSAENCTEQMGVPGPWHERLPHFKMGFTPSSGKELQSEYFVPREKSVDAIRAVERLHEKISPHILITEIRCIDADDLWMSPCYRQASTTIHFTWQQDWPAVSKLLPLIEEALAPFNAKPHWGKLFSVSHQRFQSLYKRMGDFQQLLKQYDPQGKFRNDFLDKHIFGSSNPA